MRRTMIATALLALSLAPALQAQYRDNRGYPDQDRYRNDSRYGRGQRIDAVADEIADVAYSIRREYERNNRRPDRGEARVLSDLRELDNRAHHFQSQVGYDSRQNRHDANDFTALEEAYFDLAESLRYISPRPYVDRGMDRISGLMREASRYYGRDNRDGRGSRYDRYGRNRDWHDRYDRDGRYGRDRDDDAYRTRPPQK